MIIKLEYLLISSNKGKREANWGHLNLNNATEAETETTIKCSSVMGIIIPLDIASITL